LLAGELRRRLGGLPVLYLSGYSGGRLLTDPQARCWRSRSRPASCSAQCARRSTRVPRA